MMNEMDFGNVEAMEVFEMSPEEMDEVAGGFKKPAAKNGYTIYQIKKGDTLIRIANAHGISNWRKILEWNPKITDPRLIRTGDYLYLRK